MPRGAVTLHGTAFTLSSADAIHGTGEQVRLAAQAAADMVAGRRVSTAALVVSLRDFIRQARPLTPLAQAPPLKSKGP